MEQEYKYMVCTVCATYNHAPYIVDAMNGFTMQETTFPVYYLITDDASTDGEPEVIKQYLAEHFQTPYRTEETDDYHLICATHKTNPNCNFIVFLLKYNHYSIKKSKLPYQTEWRDNAKYIALCEGDDFWITPDKLQKQVELLDMNPQVSLVATGYYSRIKGRDIENTVHKGNKDFFLFDLNDWQKTYLTKTLTLAYRAEASKYYNSITANFKYKRDVHLFYYLLRWGPGIYITKATGVYNIHPGGICSSNPKSKNAYIAYMCYKELYDQEPKDDVLRVLLFYTICLRLRRRLPEYNAKDIYKEGLALSMTFKEKLKLTRDYIMGFIFK